MTSNLKSLVALIALIPLVSGCVGGDDGEGKTDDETTSGTDGTADGTTGTTDGGGNEPPVADIEVAVLDEANHTYEFDGSGSSDPDGDNLTFLWDLGDGSTSTNATVEHTFDTTGLSGNISFSVNLTVTDDQGATSLASTMVNFTAGPAPGTLYETTTFEDEGTLIVGTANQAGVDGVDQMDFTVTIAGAATDGTPAEAGTARIKLDAISASGVDMDLYFLDPAGEELKSAATEAADEELEYDDPMPPGDYVIRVVLWAGAATDFAVTAEFDYYTV